MEGNKLREPEIQVIIDELYNESSSQFTAILKPFRKKYTDYGPLYDKSDDWLEVFDYFMQLYIKERTISPNKFLRYNLLRFIRLLSTSYFVQLYRFKELTLLYFDTLNDPDGKIRNAGYQLLGNMQFGLPGRIIHADEEKPARENWMNIFFTLLRLEQSYEKENKSKLLKRELSGRKYRKLSIDTDDIFLKNIRRGIEVIDRGFYFDEILEEFGLLENIRHPEALKEYYDFKKRFNK